MHATQRLATIVVACVTSFLCASAQASDVVPRIPLNVGLTIVTAVHETDGDYESIKTFIAADAQSVRLKYSSEAAVPGDILNETSQYLHYRPHPTDSNQVIQMITVSRTVFRKDLETSDHYVRLFPTPPAVGESVLGGTAVGTSARVLNAFKSRGAAELTTYYDINDAQPLVSVTAEDGPQPFTGTLQRVESGDVPMPVIVNGKLVNLPAVHAKGRMLDDPANPLTLRFNFDKTRLSVIRINFAGDAGTLAAAEGANIEQSLTNTGHAVVYGIYFGFNSDVIRPESEPVLKEIAAVMSRHPDWNLHVDGHTDNIGGAAFNLALSTRRSAAVKKALTERYHITPARLATAGFGLSAPKASNDTLEGRALNRRVELSKD